MKTIKVDLRKDPGDRWQFSPADIADAKRLVDFYTEDIGGVASHREALEMYDLSGHLAGPYRAEIADIIDRPYLKVLLANVYYDALKLVMGSPSTPSPFQGEGWGEVPKGFACSAYAVDTPAGPVHARNLDWWTEDNRSLSTGSRIVEFTGGGAGPFSIIGWPSFLGAFSAIAPGRFSFSLNTVTSDDPLQFAAPVTLVLRDILETAPTYAEALERIAKTPLMCDCLILIAGTKRGEMAVVERTPSRSAVRGPENGFIAVTNSYRALATRDSAYRDLGSTACERYDRIEELLLLNRNRAPYELYSMLSDSRIKMATLTVQQMVMCPATGEFTAAAV